MVGHQVSQGKGQVTSQKLGRTLSELESALSAWETLSQNVSKTAEVMPGNTPTPAAPPSEMIAQTKQLLETLREQLAELSE